MVAAGALDRRITIQRKTVTQDDYGQEVETWADFAEVWAAQKPMRGNERFAVQQLLGTGVMTFQIRYRPDLAPSVEDRIEYDGRSWDITDVRELGRRESWEIDAKARTDVP